MPNAGGSAGSFKSRALWRLDGTRPGDQQWPNGAWPHVLLVSFALVACLAGCDVVSRDYNTLAAARADGHLDRGWLPGPLPESARNIEARNRLDVNLSFGEFDYRVGDDPATLAAMQPGAPDESPFSNWAQTGADRRADGWWPWTYREGGTTWVFFCARYKGRCETWMWHEREPVVLPTKDTR